MPLGQEWNTGKSEMQTAIPLKPGGQQKNFKRHNGKFALI